MWGSDILNSLAWQTVCADEAVQAVDCHATGTQGLSSFATHQTVGFS